MRLVVFGFVFLLDLVLVWLLRTQAERVTGSVKEAQRLEAKEDE